MRFGGSWPTSLGGVIEPEPKASHQGQPIGRRKGPDLGLIAKGRRFHVLGDFHPRGRRQFAGLTVYATDPDVDCLGGNCCQLVEWSTHRDTTSLPRVSPSMRKAEPAASALEPVMAANESLVAVIDTMALIQAVFVSAAKNGLSLPRSLVQAASWTDPDAISVCICWTAEAPNAVKSA